MRCFHDDHWKLFCVLNVILTSLHGKKYRVSLPWPLYLIEYIHQPSGASFRKKKTKICV
jgi:hypothetical protein